MTALRLDAIPGYVVHELLETSLVTSTYLASRAADGYPVMLEILNHAPASLEAVERFRATVEAVAAVRHPVVPTIREIGEAHGRLYLISSAVEGRALATALRDGRPLPPPEALAVCTELADALDTLNAGGVVHGAVNPLTVWLNDRSRAPSAPFVSLRGVGTALPDVADLAGTEDLPPPDDLRYVAPELLRGEPPSGRSDQYALACLTLHCLAGAPPFDQQTLDSLVRAHLLTPPDDRELHADELGPQVAAGLRRALAKDPAERYPSSLALAEAIGGGTNRSWSWMIDDADGAARGHRGVDHAGGTARGHRGIDHAGAASRIDRGDSPNGTGPAAASGGRPAQADDREAKSDGRATAGPGLSGRSLPGAAGLPDTATPSGPPRPVGPDQRVAGPGTTRRRRRRSRLLRAGRTRWALVAALLTLVVVAAVLTGLRLMAPATTETADGSALGASTEKQASWRELVSPGTPLTQLAALGEELVAVAGDELRGLDQATAQERWRTSLNGEITDLSTMGETIVAHTGDGFVGVDRTSGELRWRSTDTGLPELAAVVMGRGRMFGVAEATDGAVTVHAVDPHTGEIGWSIEDRGSDTGDVPAAVAFDDSEQGQPTLYVMRGDAITAFDTTSRRPRWQVSIDGARPDTLTALTGGVLLLTADGRLCRYATDSGEPVWSECASLQREDPDARIVSVHDNRVIVVGAHEVMSVDFTSGRRQWRTTSDRALQPPVTTSPSAAYIAAPDGTVVAIGQRDGAALWETAAFGSVTAMATTDEAVFVATGDGRLTRLDAAADSDA